MLSALAAARMSAWRGWGIVPRSFQPWTVVTAMPSFAAIGRMPPKRAMMRSAWFMLVSPQGASPARRFDCWLDWSFVPMV